MEPVILVADDDASIRLVMSQTLLQEGYKVRATDSPEALLKWIKAGEGDVVVTDVYMHDTSIFERLPEIKRTRPDLPVIVISAQNTVLTATSALEHGAHDYLPKPFSIDELADKVSRALERAPKRDRLDRSRGASQASANLPMMGRSPAMQAVYRSISRVMNLSQTVLLKGETGAGKRRTALAIHDLGSRKEHPFFEVRASQLELAHHKPDFAEIISEKATSGTVFISEAGLLSQMACTNLLELIDCIESLPSERKPPRIIAGWTEDNVAAVPEDPIRRELFFRLDVLPISLPALRQRRDDIPELVNAFIETAAVGPSVRKAIEPAALNLLAAYDWPGNVRELKNVVLRLCAFAPHTTITANDVGSIMTRQSVGHKATTGFDEELGLLIERRYGPELDALGEGDEGQFHAELVQSVEKPLIELALKATRGNKLRAAAMLGMNRNTLRSRIQALEIDG